MDKFKAFLKRKDIEISAKRYGIDALGAMAQGLFCSLLIGTIINTLGTQFGLPFLNEIGGFGAGIHNTLEAAVYGLPIAFGPRYQKFNEATEMISRGIAHSISDYDELRAWFMDMKDEDMWHSVHHAAERYTSANCGATERICKVISSE